jgi:hypothetical protein
VTALEIVKTIEQAGGSVEAVGSDRVRVLAPTDVLTDALKADVVEHKPELLTILRGERGEGLHLLAEDRWPPSFTMCSFLIGHPGDVCGRCGASWLEHYPSSR